MELTACPLRQILCVDMVRTNFATYVATLSRVSGKVKRERIETKPPSSCLQRTQKRGLSSRPRGVNPGCTSLAHQTVECFTEKRLKLKRKKRVRELGPSLFAVF